MAGAQLIVTNPDAPRRAADRGIGEIADRIRDEAAARTPVDTGRLQASWHVVELGEGAREVATDVPYARYVEYGTRYDAAQPMLGPVVAQYRNPL